MTSSLIDLAKAAAAFIAIGVALVAYAATRGNQS